MRRAIYLLLLALLLPCAAHAEDWDRAYGGRSEDRLTELAPAPGGLFAVGTSFSSDGDLEGRTRSGKTGWALRLDGEGNVLFSLSSAHAGRTYMEHPFAHADGTLSCVLRGDGAGAEWLRVSAQGRVTARVEIPEPERVCAHAPDGEEMAAFPCDLGGRPSLLLCVAHGDGSFCFPGMDEEGIAFSGARVSAAEGALLRVGAGGDAALVWTRDGAAHVAEASPGDGDARIFSVAAPGIDRALDALVGEDGSVILSASAADGGWLARVSAAGDTLFCVPQGAAAERLALTGTGFAASCGEELLFFDEEGALLGARERTAARGESLAMAGFGAGVALLSYLPDGALAKQAHIATAVAYARAEPDALANALYAHAGGRLLAAQGVPEGFLLLVEDEDGQAAGVLVDEHGLAREDARQAQRQDAGRLPDGRLAWEADRRGALVTRYGADGAVRWQTHTPIYTAADRLEWRCAAQGSDALLLGGRYVTGAGEGEAHQAVVAWLGRDGVLRRIETVEGALDVCSAQASGGAVYLLVSREAGLADAVLRLGEGGWARPLDVPLEADGACLLASGGALYAAGTHAKDGRRSAVLQAVDGP